MPLYQLSVMPMMLFNMNIVNRMENNATSTLGFDLVKEDFHWLLKKILMISYFTMDLFLSEAFLI